MASPVHFSRSSRVTSVLTRAIKVTAETRANASSWASSASSQLLLSKWKSISVTQKRIFSGKRQNGQISTCGPSVSAGDKGSNSSEDEDGPKSCLNWHGNSKCNPNGALSGITILDFTRVLAGPFCTQFLGDLGAQIIKVEEPTKGDDTRGYGPPFFSDSPDGSKNSAYFVSVNRNKESIGVNLKDPRGVQLIHQLVSEVDVVIENFTPGVADRLGIGFDSLSKVNSSLIYCSISGFGQSGIHSRRPGYDVIASSIGGLLSITGPEFGDPCRPGVPIIDLITGLYATCAILTALYNRTNEQMASLLDGQLTYTSNVADVSNRPTESNTTAHGTSKVTQMNNKGKCGQEEEAKQLHSATAATCLLMNNQCNKGQKQETSTPREEQIHQKQEHRSSITSSSSSYSSSSSSSSPSPSPSSSPSSSPSPSSPLPGGRVVISKGEFAGKVTGEVTSKVNGESTGKACHGDTRVTGPVKIDVNLLSSQISVLINIALNYLNFNLIANRRGTAHETIVPYQAFACKAAAESPRAENHLSPHLTDTKGRMSEENEASPSASSPDYLTVIAGNDSMFVKLIKLLFADDAASIDEILSNEKFKSNADRQVNRKQLVSILQSKLNTKTRNEWIALLENSGLPYGPVNTIDQVFSDPHIKSGTTFTVDGVTYLKNAVKFQSETQFHRRDFIPPAKKVGQDTGRLLSSILHLTPDQLHQLALDGVIRL